MLAAIIDRYYNSVQNQFHRALLTPDQSTSRTKYIFTKFKVASSVFGNSWQSGDGVWGEVYYQRVYPPEQPFLPRELTPLVWKSAVIPGDPHPPT